MSPGGSGVTSMSTPTAVSDEVESQDEVLRSSDSTNSQRESENGHGEEAQPCDGADDGGPTRQVQPASAAMPTTVTSQDVSSSNQIMASIAHRRKLLKWIRQGRMKSESLRARMISGECPSFIDAMLNQHNADVSNPRPEDLVNNSSNSLERQNYEKLRKIAHARSSSTSKLLKKQKSSSHVDGKARRGSLASKKPTQGPKKKGEANIAGEEVKQSCNLEDKAPIANSAAQTSKAIVQQPNSTAAGVDPSQSSEMPYVDKKKYKKRSSIKKPDTTALHPKAPQQHAAKTSSANGQPSKEQTPSQQQYIPSSIAVQLLQRKDELTLQLENSVKAKEQDVRAESHGWRRLGAMDNFDSSSSLGLPSQPPRFPKRIRTQWDCVLDEVKWMATDFIEERKWKTAFSTKLSRELMKHTKEGKKRRGSVSARRGNGKVGSTPAKATEARGRRYMADINPIFVKPSGEDLRHARNVAQLMSSKINGQWDRVVNGDVCASEEERPSRFDLVKCEMIGACCDQSFPETNFSAEQVRETSGATDNKQQQLSPTELDSDQITAQLRLISTSMKSIRDKCSGAFVHGDCQQSLNCSVELNSSQLESVNLVDNFWASVAISPRSAVLLGGNLGCGKTVSACALLWKYRDTGRQLIVCSSDGLRRWKDELTRFDDGWDIFIASSVDDIGHSESAITICNYSTFECVGDAHFIFKTLVLDLRRHVGSCDGTLDSVKWWVHLNKFATRNDDMNRLVVEQTDFAYNRLLPSGVGDTGKKRYDQLLAMKLAYMSHPSIFHSTQLSIGKRAVAWAKRHSTPSLGREGIRSTLTSALASMLDCCTVVVATADAVICDGLQDLPAFSWELRSCELGSEQRVVYDQCCYGIQMNENEDIANDLMRLRRVCLHSNVGAMQSVCALTRSSTHSEPDFSLASSISRQSSKMTELMSLLAIYGHDVSQARSFILNVNIDSLPSGGTAGSDERTKVVILATLPEAQQLTSTFLRSIGLSHEVLTNCGLGSALSRRRSQEVLSRFNFTEDDGRNVDILVAPPLSLSSLVTGGTLLSADVIISVDEDWSGREALHINSILTKTRVHRLASSQEPPRLIKLICQNTCEETFLCDGKMFSVDPQPADLGGGEHNKRRSRRSARRSVQDVNNAAGVDNEITAGERMFIRVDTSRSANHLSVDRDGYLVLSDRKHAFNGDQIGSNILRHRGSDLSAVLRASAMVSTNGSLFLPLAAADAFDEVSVTASIVKSEQESVVSLSFRDTNICPSGVGRSIGEGPSICNYMKTTGQRQSRTKQNGRVQLKSLDCANEEISTSEETGNKSGDVSPILTYTLPEHSSRGRAEDSQYMDVASCSDAERNSFAYCYSLFNDSAANAEPNVYSPAFLPHLLQMHRSASRQSFASEDFPGRHLRSSSPNDPATLFSPRELSKKHDLVEADVYQHRGLESNMNADIIDLRGNLSEALTSQSWPALNAIIIVAQKRLLDDSSDAASQPPTKKTKGGSLSPRISQSSLRQKFFQHGNLPSQSFSANEGVKDKFATTLLGRVRLRQSLNDIVTGEESYNTIGESVHSIRRKRSAPNVCPSILFDKTHLAMLEGKSGISLPMGVKNSRMAKKYLHSMQESSEPWSAAEDSLLKDTVARYGNNWHMVAEFMSTHRNSMIPVDERSSLNGALSLRSPSQCLGRWGQLCTSLDPVTDGKLNPLSTSCSEEVMPRFKDKTVDNKSECIIYGTSSQDNFLSDSGITKAEASTSTRIEHLCDISKKRRAVANPTINQGSTHQSHNEAVQTARSNMVTAAGGVAPQRLEMWPLELLDYTRRNHKRPKQRERNYQSPAPAHSSSQGHSSHRSTRHQPNYQTHPQYSHYPPQNGHHYHTGYRGQYPNHHHHNK